jgi:hypothetical protein
MSNPEAKTFIEAAREAAARPPAAGSLGSLNATPTKPAGCAVLLLVAFPCCASTQAASLGRASTRTQGRECP